MRQTAASISAAGLDLSNHQLRSDAARRACSTPAGGLEGGSAFDAEGRGESLYLSAAATLAVSILCLDVLSPLQGASAVLYTIVVLVAARSQRLGAIAAAGLGGGAMALVGYAAMHWDAPLGSPAMRLAVSLIAIAVTTMLALRHQTAIGQKLRSEQWYRTLFDSAGLPIWEADWSDGFKMIQAGAAPNVELAARAALTARVRDANEATARLFGYVRREELLGVGISTHHTDHAVGALARMFASLTRGEDTVEEETQFRTLRGTLVEVVLRVTLPPGHDGWRHVLVMALDVTERNRAQNDLAQARADLVQVSRLTTLGEMAASIAHEINQPLAAVLTYAQSGGLWLTRTKPDIREAVDALDHVARNAARAADIVARIRDVVRRDGAAHELVDLASLTTDTATLLAREFEVGDVRLELDVDRHVRSVCGDRTQLQQVLMNLMLNAIQAMTDEPAGNRALRLRVSAEGDDVTVEVRDTGPGLPDGGLEHLFEPFFTTKPDGLGLGLSICRSIIERHGGTLTARSDPAGGAAFRVQLRGTPVRRKAAA